jgi:hypothetical protein
MSEFQHAAIFLVDYAIEFGKHGTKPPHTKFQTQILMYSKAAVL